MKHILTAILLALCFIPLVNAQTINRLSLKEVVQLALDQSPAAKRAKTNYINSYWAYKNYKTNFLPQLSLTATLPDFTRSIVSTPQNDGSIAFRPRSLASSSLGLGLTQNIAGTNTQLFVNSDLERIDLFEPAQSVNYLANPAVIGFRQPLHQFNSFKWDKKTEPLRFEMARRAYFEEMENVSLQATELFFNLLLAQINRSIELKNLSNSDTLYKISKGRYNLGKIAENELLQMELNVMNAKSSLAQANMDVDIASMQLRNFLRLSGNESMELLQPDLVSPTAINEEVALEQARKNRKTVLEIEINRLEARKALEKAKMDNGLNANLSASYGLTQSRPLLMDTYVNPQATQRFSVGVSVPVFDWGRRNSQIKTAKANQELAELQAEQDVQAFEQEVKILSRQLNMLNTKLVIAAKADTIAFTRYDLTMKRYMIGKIGITDVNISLNEKDQAKRAFVEALKSYWSTYYDLRRKTLYDFEAQKTIVYDPKK